MPSPQGVINKLNAALSKLTPLDRTVTKRTLTRTGGDSLTGRSVASSHVDVLLNPQPYYNRIGRQHVPGGHAQFQELVTPGGTRLLADDWEFIVSPTAVSVTDLGNPDIIFVLTDVNGVEEEVKPLDTDSLSFKSTDVMYTMYMRSLKRT